jgi:hypothetical protein
MQREDLRKRTKSYADNLSNLPGWVEQKIRVKLNGNQDPALIHVYVYNLSANIITFGNIRQPAEVFNIGFYQPLYYIK